MVNIYNPNYSSHPTQQQRHAVGRRRKKTRAQIVTEGERENTGFVAGMHIDERKSIFPIRGPSAKGGGGH